MTLHAEVLDESQRRILPGLALEEVQTAPGTLHALTEGVRLSFLRYDYPLVGELLRSDEYAFALASLDDLACMKLAAVAQRGSRKDFVDVYAIGVRHRPLAEMLELYRRKYSTSDIGHVLMGLAYLDDAEEEPMPKMIWDVSWDEVTRRISDWVRKAAG